MKFYEKLITLRKKALLSQEQLAERLNVTRQTISKWELGQSKPDMDKLKEISKLFEIDIETLTNDEISLENVNNINNVKKEDKKNDSGNRKIILYIVIVIFIVSLVTLTYRVGTVIKTKIDETKEEINKTKEEAKKKQEEAEKRRKEIEEKIKEEQERQEQEQKEREEELKKDSFNSKFEFYQGTNGGTAVGMEIDKIVENNKKNTTKLIEVIFDGTSYGTDAENIRKIKNSLKDFNGYKLQQYEVSLDYDTNGYVNKVTIETK